ncbi:MAG: GtrA family protein [Cyclobacteriaceae bacterium]
MTMEFTSELFWKLLKFGAVGASGLVLDFGLTYLGKEKLGISKYLANAIGFCTAASTNFLFNRWWTFSDTNPDITSQFTRFFLIALVGLAINTAIIWFAHQKKGMNFFVAKILAVGVVVIWNFVMNVTFTFN